MSEQEFGVLPGPVEPAGGVREPVGACHDGWVVGKGTMITVTDPNHGGYSAGYVVTPNGVVGVYFQSGNSPRFKAHTSFDFVHAGRTHRVSWQRTFSDRFVKTLAKRFAADVVRGVTA